MEPLTGAWTSQDAGYAFAVYVVLAIGLWPTLVKAGMPGWGAIIPIYNLYLVIKVAGWNGVAILLFLVPIVNIVVAVLLAAATARAYGRGILMAILLFFVAPLAFLIIGFGSSRYRGESFARA